MARVLIVDDEPNIRAVLRGYLEADGFQVIQAADGKAAVASVRADHPDLVLLDVMLRASTDSKRSARCARSAAST